MDIQKNTKTIEEIKRLNDLSAGNRLHSIPITIEKMKIDPQSVENLSLARPRLLFQQKDFTTFQSKVKENRNHCGWEAFVEKQKDKLNSTPHEAPKRYPEETVKEAHLWRPYWRAMYMACQESLNAVRNLSIVARIDENQQALVTAKKWLLSLTEYETDGPTARAYNDEAAFRTLAGLAWGYDWLYDSLSADEKAKIKECIIIRLEEVMSHLKNDVKILENPLNSHGVRSISSVVVPCAIVLYGEYPKAKEYLLFSLNYYAEFYPPWGGRDGAWAEGPDYWNTAMAVLGEAFDLIKSYVGLNLYQKDFYKNTGEYILYCMPVHSRRASFCDQSSIGDLPGLKLGYNMRQFAAVSNKATYMWYFNQLYARDKDAESKFYNYGWWDFSYDTLRFSHLWTTLEEIKPSDEAMLKVFPEIGWAAFHKNISNQEKHVHLIFKSSVFGSLSHSNGDQNAFTLHAYGETLAAITGYYGGYGVDMHLKWRRQTKSKNLILIGNQGQYGENATSNPDHQDQYCLDAHGAISKYDEKAPIPFLIGDATAAYKYNVPDIKSYLREIHSIEGDVFVMLDRIDLSSPKTITWLLHTTFKATTAETGFTIIGEKAQLDVSFLTEQENLESIQFMTNFADVNPEEFKGLDVHSRVESYFKAKAKHTIVTLLVPSLKNQKRQVKATIEGSKIKVTREGKEYSISF